MVNIHILLASGRLNNFESKIRQTAEDGIVKIKSKIAAEKIDIVVRDNPDGAIPEVGIGGYTLDTNYISISLNPNFPDFNSVIEKELNRTLAHEIHHALRMRERGYGETLLEALVTEGLADHFDIEVNNQKPEPWSTALNEEQTSELMEKAKTEFNSKNYSHNTWFFGSKEKRIPRWTGYSLGFKIVGDYLKKNPKEKPSTLVDRQAELFFS